MARRYLDTPTERPDTHYIECPRCGHHTIVPHGEGKFACLRCSWQRDVSHDWGPLGPLPIPVLIAIVIILIIVTIG